MLGGNLPMQMVEKLYYGAANLDSRLMERMGDPGDEIWGDRERVLASIIKANGVAKTLWLSADRVLFMLNMLV